MEDCLIHGNVEIMLIHGDISDRIQRLDSFITLSSDPIWCYELDVPMTLTLSAEEQAKYLFEHSIIKECNLATAKMYGFDSVNQMIDKYVKDLIPLTDLSPLIRFVESGYELINEEYIEVLEFNKKRHFILTVKGQIEDNKFIRSWGQQKDITLIRESEEKLNELLTHSRIIGEISKLFVCSRPEEIDKTVISAFSKIGEFLNSDAILLSEILNDKTHMSVHYEWTRKEIPSIKKTYQKLPVISMLPEDVGILANKGFLIYPDIETLPKESWIREMSEVNQIRSLMLVGLKNEGNLIGILAFVKLYEIFDWPESSQNLVGLAVDIISQCILRARNEINLKNKEKALKEYYSEIKSDLQLAKLTQDAWIMQAFPKYDTLQFHSFFVPIGDIGGDLILYNVPKSDFIDILFGDISGHGISSALISGIITMTFKRLSDEFHSPKELLQNLEKELCFSIDRNHLSCCLLRINIKTLEASFCFAGHPPLITWNKSNPIKTQQIFSANYPLLLVNDWIGHEINYQFQKGDSLFLYSDGIYEIEKETDGFLGLDSFLTSLKSKILTKSGDHLIADVMKDAIDENTKRIYDDIALLLIEFS
ncbi:MAG: GAF domain-containing SpoIIE family protein phosphatase [Leptospira sp.]|nr:GAF domain-containing SpoIIE family protein phosphatase [Leptospira sp.]